MISFVLSSCPCLPGRGWRGSRLDIFSLLVKRGQGERSSSPIERRPFGTQKHKDREVESTNQTVNVCKSHCNYLIGGESEFIDSLLLTDIIIAE